MRRCPYCKVNIAGDLGKCPLCQSKLGGGAEEPCYPKFEAQKKRSFFYKMQLLAVWSILIIGVCLDFMVKIRLRQFKPGTGSAGKVTMMVIITIAMWCVTAYFFGLLKITLDLVVPVVLAATITANFVLALIDKNGNTMLYLLTGLFMGLVPSIIYFFASAKMPIAWVICLMVSVILFAGSVIFRGRAVAAEFQRRFHL